MKVANIPMNKLKNKNIREFLTKYYIKLFLTSRRYEKDITIDAIKIHGQKFVVQ